MERPHVVEAQTCVCVMNTCVSRPAPSRSYVVSRTRTNVANSSETDCGLTDGADLHRLTLPPQSGSRLDFQAADAAVITDSNAGTELPGLVLQ